MRLRRDRSPAAGTQRGPSAEPGCALDQPRVCRFTKEAPDLRQLGIEIRARVEPPAHDDRRNVERESGRDGLDRIVPKQGEVGSRTGLDAAGLCIPEREDRAGRRRRERTLRRQTRGVEQRDLLVEARAGDIEERRAVRPSQYRDTGPSQLPHELLRRLEALARREAEVAHHRVECRNPARIPEHGLEVTGQEAACGGTSAAPLRGPCEALEHDKRRRVRQALCERVRHGLRERSWMTRAQHSVEPGEMLHLVEGEPCALGWDVPDHAQTRTVSLGAKHRDNGRARGLQDLDAIDAIAPEPLDERRYLAHVPHHHRAGPAFPADQQRSA
jgi:hypothetical protein